MVELPVRQYFLNIRQEMAAFVPKTFSKTLEIGCGAGGFSRQFLTSGEEMWGVEPDVNAAAIAAPNFDRLLVGTFDQVSHDLPDQYFDLVVCNDVIEHMPDHDKFLQDIKAKMRHGAAIVGSVPNVRHFTAMVKLMVLKDWPYADDGILDRTHLRFFTEKSLRRAFVENGYEVEELKGIRSIIKEGVTGLPPAKKKASKIAAAVVVAATLGFWADTQYSQLGFRVRLP